MLWGFTYIVSATLLPHNPLLIASTRALGGAIALMLFARQFPPREWLGRVIVLGTLNGGLFFGLLFVGVMRLPGGVAAVLQALAPLCAVLLGWAILSIRPTWIKIASIFLGVIGVSLVVLKGAFAVDGIGIAAAFGSTLSVALGGVLMNRWGKPPIGLIAFTGWQLLIAGVELSVVGIAMGSIPAHLTTTNIVGLALLAVFITAIPFALWFKAIGAIGAVAASPFFLLVPVTAFVLDALIRGIIPTGMQVFGTIVVLGALLLSQWTPKRKAVPA